MLIFVTDLHVPVTKFSTHGNLIKWVKVIRCMYECAHNHDQMHGSISGMSVLLKVSLTIKCKIKLEISVSVSLGDIHCRVEWGVACAVDQSHKI